MVRRKDSRLTSLTPTAVSLTSIQPLSLPIAYSSSFLGYILRPHMDPYVSQGSSLSSGHRTWRPIKMPGKGLVKWESKESGFISRISLAGSFG